ncbi:MAG TPA: tripartite tricarboxylate transporter substrate-binding protein [Pseudorhodoferax sp.]|nr:tripartite tricarboxylate transporter substrate-binding protein [Pseudorhodoferax sp.]
MPIPRPTRRAALALAAALAVPSAWSQDKRPIRILVPGPAGSAMDAYLRAVSAPLGQRTGHPIVVDNLPGAGGTLATAQAARAAPDGLTLEIVSSNHVVNPFLFKNLAYDALGSFTPITIIGVVPLVLVVSPQLQAATVAELIAQIKARPAGSFNYGSLGIGTALHLAGELFDTQAGVKTTHVPYKDASALTADLVSGQIQLAYLALPSVSQLVKTGRLRALGLTTAQRSPALPDVPAIADTLPGYVYDAWLALLAPKGTPAATVQGYYEALQGAMAEPAVQQAIAAQGLAPSMLAPAQAQAYLRSELDKHARLVERAGVQPQ